MDKLSVTLPVYGFKLSVTSSVYGFKLSVKILYKHHECLLQCLQESEYVICNVAYLKTGE